MSLELVGSGESLLEIKKSKFVGLVKPVDSMQQAMLELCSVRSKYKNATHYCWAVRLQDGIAKYTDDGEPQGTAGLPIYNVLHKRGLLNIICLIVRYYGGIQLGTGGLIRAYTQVSNMAIDNAGTRLIDKTTRCCIQCEYAQLQSIKYYLSTLGVQILTTTFGNNCQLTVSVRASQMSNFVASDLYQIVEDIEGY
jgi:uncharacterized YigZ family protein